MNNTTNKYKLNPGLLHMLSNRQRRKLSRHRGALIADGKFGPMVVVDEGSGKSQRHQKLSVTGYFALRHICGDFKPSNEGVLRSSEPWQPFSFYVNPALSKIGTHSAQRNRMK